MGTAVGGHRASVGLTKLVLLDVAPKSAGTFRLTDVCKGLALSGAVAGASNAAAMGAANATSGTSARAAAAAAAAAAEAAAAALGSPMDPDMACAFARAGAAVNGLAGTALALLLALALTNMCARDVRRRGRRVPHGRKAARRATARARHSAPRTLPPHDAVRAGLSPRSPCTGPARARWARPLTHTHIHNRRRPAPHPLARDRAPPRPTAPRRATSYFAFAARGTFAPLQPFIRPLETHLARLPPAARDLLPAVGWAASLFFLALALVIFGSAAPAGVGVGAAPLGLSFGAVRLGALFVCLGAGVYATSLSEIWRTELLAGARVAPRRAPRARRGARVGAARSRRQPRCFLKRRRRRRRLTVARMAAAYRHCPAAAAPPIALPPRGPAARRSRLARVRAARRRHLRCRRKVARSH